MTKLIIINSVAGKGLKNNIVERIERSIEGLGYEIYYSKYHGDIKRKCLEVDENKINEIIIVGGDGSISEALNGLMDKKIPLRIIPNGSGNDLYRSLYGTVEVDECLDDILNNDFREIYLGKINDEIFSNVVSVGIDAFIVNFRNKINKLVHGKLLYLISAIISIIIYSPKEYSITIDNKTFKGVYYLIAIGNGMYYGGGMNITPKASLFENVLDVCLIKKMNRFRLLTLLPTVYSGKHISFDEVEYIKCKNILIKLSENDIINIDGELMYDNALNVNIYHKKKYIG